MAKELPTLGELEVRVLALVWQEQPTTERRIWDLVQKEREVGRTTVLKTMQRLETKGLLVRVRGAGPVQFRAAVPPQRVLPSLVERFVERTLGGSSAPLVAYLADQGQLSAKDLAALRAIARKLDDEAE
ncbi:MAG: BlaI/MecI/CopY family transcriptional regulator [Planctomycetia bacterium]|nr:BlaI/MecI/CopY family transcriptional regulator [Planctomycetia bacterium]